jgi:hypothetical protein
MLSYVSTSLPEIASDEGIPYPSGEDGWTPEKKKEAIAIIQG